MSSVTQPFARELSCGGRMNELPALIEFIETACDEANVKPELRFDLTLAVEEAASNVIEHGYKGKGGPLGISFELLEDVVTICLRDRARPFKPGKLNRPDVDMPLEERPLGGLGLHLMHQLMDEVRYETLPDGNLLTMVKRNAA
jgi:serine/threonine-protein kinase RsbW